MASLKHKPSFDDVEKVEELSPSIHDHERDQTVWQAFKGHPRIALFALAACSSGKMFGYDQIVNGASIALPSFILYFGTVSDTTHEPYLPSVWTSLWTAMSALLQALGGISIAPVSDCIGRRWPSIGCCVVSAGGVAIQFASASRGMLLAGKMANGFAIGAGLAVATAWASEISPMRLHGPIQSAIVLSTVLMQAMGLVVLRQNVATIEQKAFRLVFAIQWACPGLTALLFLLVPESPTWLMLRGQPEKAKASVYRLYGSATAESHSGHVERDIREEADTEHATGIGGGR
ncbi:MFS transporter fmqE [Fulvia fulva]|uniref:MFS transporter fmqE n=1 Tax=Passalora fulva TaxID=5499 RepID=A0A9Q8PCN8_PASFU|nr:MFS transporter fmqE [Fulvia fulva]KAK4619654.1 MFS transporter fmqE [Fulvia fulva]KAK4620934.1 MFS transporter fmqE [Fulvia fulva]UJO20000.1 MFS transporter fmqE [Fulvia fulva]WPV17249.1 MFS transporter fmqE [Fulvia fulva]WPV32250.1 MFS transporter fmqE [Fulvia fulva]